MSGKNSVNNDLKNVNESSNKDDEVDDDSAIFSTYADNRYSPFGTVPTTPRSRTRTSTPSPFIVLDDTEDHLERNRFFSSEK